ncbi:hypothetical protein LCGC14_0349960 [marine sediment metagenome]|uniref:Uncharacterized protein n=1 Tax=marine sediment metagenome TaxID=412755 RepID=A0A0F9TGT0_9ZZZZ
MAMVSLDYIRGIMVASGIKYLYLKTPDKVSGLSECPSAGPYPNISGMRKLYWGKDALIVKQGAYAYNVSG